MPLQSLVSLADKPVLTVNDAAALSGFSRDTITRMFQDAHGVRVLERKETTHKRKYRTIAIPREVFEREMRKVTK